MTQCLERVIASTYPKLEIIVIDDSSGDDTSILIKSFAHAGVRFVQGSPLPDTWLGKNHALQGLLNEASGSLVLYMDVDTLIEPDTIEQLVAYAQQEKATMISVLPQRQDSPRMSVIFGTLRYYWELILHRRRSPAVASSAWMIRRTTLIDDYDVFNNLKSAIQPESQLAAALLSQNAYRFLISTPLLGVSYEKRWRSQIDTSLRLLYPIVGGNYIKSFIAVGVLLLLNQPLVTIISAAFTGWTIIHAMALWQLSVSMALYGVYLSKVWSRGWWLGVLLWQYVIAQELVVLLISINRYSVGHVNWKGRPVALSLRRQHHLHT
jgi:glycosyltransferase involved in cell wall biosynthesis